ncbi:J domain-containing protein [Sulfuriferula nivalis]|uniref:Molecular chaperone DnaJ n=1 Tax=Sulfuriferula nivalis TaxID=2675298 RepID=A0A809SB43_9PROT|nr:J domain-containing protein [Sulfuriferula nivalis]BBP02463.1 molecular chaperone DnaJ [Sulfuriferula nivalis]
MLTLKTKAISITTGQNQSTLSRTQKTFNTLIKKIEDKRTYLAAWQEIIPHYQKRHVSELLPLIESATKLQVEMVLCLDRAYDQKGLTATERREVAFLISDLAGDLAADLGDEQMKRLYNKHSGSNYDTEESTAANEMRLMFEEMMGVDLGEGLEGLSPEAFLKHAQERMLEQQAAFEAAREAQAARRASRKKSAKQIAKEEQQKAEDHEIGQSVREVYRKLVSMLHPDRETNPEERERKTTLMQRVNQAYDKKNLLLLLELQLELEHIDQTIINNLSESRLKHFTKILKEQLAELEQEIFYTEDRFKGQFGILPFVRMRPDSIMQQLHINTVRAEQTVSNLERELLMLQDIKTLKVWLGLLHN